MDRLGHISNHTDGTNYFQPVTNVTIIDTSALGSSYDAVRGNTMYLVASADNTFTGTWTGTAGSRWLSAIDYLDTAASSVLTHGTTAGSGYFFASAISMPFVSSLYPNYSSLVLRAGTTGVSGFDSLFRMKLLARDSGSLPNAADGFIISQTSSTIVKTAFGLNTTTNYINGTNIISGTPEICPPFSISGTSVNISQFGIHSTDASPTFVFAAFIIQGIQFLKRKSHST